MLEEKTSVELVYVGAYLMALKNNWTRNVTNISENPSKKNIIKRSDKKSAFINIINGSNS